ncbi:hypothetical protein B566_EDAN018633 [Ephemera danica]|nr:hypothetical protein B566_EDAN018633 [Ephemera danica]
MRNSVLSNLINLHIPPQSVEEQWDVPGLEKMLAAEYQLQLPISKWLETEPDLHEETLHQRITDHAQSNYQGKTDLAGSEVMHQYERAVMLQSLDTHWREHLASLDHLRQGIHLRGYAQKNPKQEYKREAFELFSGMLEEIKSEVTRILLTVQIRNEQQLEEAVAVAETHPPAVNMQYYHSSYEEALGKREEFAEGLPDTTDSPQEKSQPFTRHGMKIGRNDPCPCGSGKKYKQCHGKLG